MSKPKKIRQYDRVTAVLLDLPLEHKTSLYKLREAIWAKYNVIDSEAGISARIREIREDFENHHSLTIVCVKAKGLRRFDYWVAPYKTGEVAAC